MCLLGIVGRLGVPWGNKTDRQNDVIRAILVNECTAVSVRITMQSDELAHLSKVYSVIDNACIPIFHCILNNYA